MAKAMIYAVFDNAIQAFGNPIFVAAAGAATRSFTDEVNRAGSPFNAHPDDYELFCLGIWDDNSGSFEPRVPELIVRAKDIVRARE